MKKRNILKNIMIGIFLFIISFFSLNVEMDASSGHVCMDCTSNPENICPIKKEDKKNYCNIQFNLDESLEDNREFWSRSCGPNDEECVKEYVKAEKNFYARMYGILKSYQKNDPSLYIDHHVIVQVALFGVTPGESSTGYGEFQSNYTSKKNGYTRDPYASDDPSDMVNADGEDGLGNDFGDDDEAGMEGYESGEDPVVDKAYEETGHTSNDLAMGGSVVNNYYEKEKDTLKTLINNTLTIDAKCWIVQKKHQFPETIHYPNGTEETGCVTDVIDEDGNEKRVITDEYQVNDITYLRRGRCAKLYEPASNTHAYYEYYGTRINIFADYLPVLKPILMPNDKIKVLKADWEAKDYQMCKQLKKDNPKIKTYFTYYGSEFKVNYRKFWDFLVSTRYFDAKKQLQDYYGGVFRRIYDDTHEVIECMDDEICDHSMTNEFYEKYAEEIADSRKMIVYNIFSLLEPYLREIYTEEDVKRILDYDGYWDEDLLNVGDTNARQSYLWPIGSRETWEREGIIFADGEPESTDVVSDFGRRTNEATGRTENHYGIDIAGVEGETNVISVYDGEVISVVSDCQVGDYECNNGLGNAIIIQHSNGDYAIYGHLSDVFVSGGESVKRGQRIAHVGRTGATLKAVLHYETRVGGLGQEYAVDPMGFMDFNNPRPSLGPANTGEEAKAVCRALKSSGYSDKAIAAIMTSLNCESGFHADRVQGDIPYSQTSINYTRQVTNETISKNNFIHNGPGGGGYGLAQWTSSGRKENLYNFWKSRYPNKSIGDLEMQVQFLRWEIDNSSGYITTRNALNNTTIGVYQMARIFCENFEAPEDKSSVCKARAEAYAETFYNMAKNGCSA